MVAKIGMHKSPRSKEVCECGWKISGISKEHLKANMKMHRGSKFHKQIMKNKKQGETK